MNTSAIRLLAKLGTSNPHVVERVEIAAPRVLEYVSGALGLIRAIREVDPDHPLLTDLRLARWRCLYSASEFHKDQLLDPLEAFRSKQAVRDRWGDSASRDWAMAREAGMELSEAPSVLRSMLRERLTELVVDHDQRVMMYCDRSDAVSTDVEGLLGRHADEMGLLHTLGAYKACDLFNVLLKIGPLHGFGRGKLPDAVLVAPRFDRLLQFVWAGTRDAADYPLEPLVTDEPSWELLEGDSTAGQQLTLSSGVVWHRVVERHGNLGTISWSPDEEEDWESESRQDRDSVEFCDAVLAIFPDGCAALFAPGGHELTYLEHGAAGKRALLRTIGEEFTPGLWWAKQAVMAPGLAPDNASHGVLSAVWKRRLAEALNEPVALEQRLRGRGIGIQALQHRMQEWCKTGMSVITAPKVFEDFERLLEELRPWDADPSVRAAGAARWIRSAWNEVIESRTDRIVDGVAEHELINAHLVGVIEERLDPADLRSVRYSPFRLTIEDDDQITGHVDLYPIRDVDVGYRCPVSRLRHLMTLDEAAQWQG